MKQTLAIISAVVALRDRTADRGDREILADAANELSSMNARRTELLEALDWLLASVTASPADERYPGDNEERLTLACAAAEAAISKALSTEGR